jgi:photosystem II stability/assembly factor-like uncharacterized protein
MIELSLENFCNKLKLSFFVGLYLIISSMNSYAQDTKQYSVEYFQTIPSTQIRSIEVISDTKIWFAAYHGIWGYTEDGGKTWRIDSIKNEKSELNFRSMAVLNDSTVLLMSIASPAYIYKTSDKGKTWRIVYENTDKDAFLDCLKFYDDKNGFALGDPLNGCATLLQSTDAGENWQRIACDKLPSLQAGESFFAASNSNMKIVPPNIFIATGGKYSRLWHSKNMGKSYASKSVPLPTGEQMTGVFSADFYTEKLGAIAGGHYDKKDSLMNCLAITRNVGDTWEVLSFNRAMFGSCVQFINERTLILTGHSGTALYYLDTKKYDYLKDQHNNELMFHTLKVSPSRKYVWFGGRNGSLARMLISR